MALQSFFARGPPPSTLRFPWAEGGAILKCSISYPSGALTDPGASLTLNVLLLYANKRSDGGSLCSAFGSEIRSLL